MAGNKMQFQYEITANTSQAKKALTELDSALARLRKQDKLNLGLSDELSEAATAAKILQKELNAAFNTTTGKLDISQLAQGLAAAGTSVDQLSMKFLNAGTMGQAAFRSLAQSIALADVPIKKMNATLSNMMTTLKNTVKWELSSTAIHGLERALSGAVSYAKNLNTSLTNIRIVTGQSVEDMARFTKEANTAAKALSTTTKSYTDASLIYYQQGDNQEMAAKKAAITIKAANASFETSAKEMSEYLTSVWNSYQVGADELERYVDIMASLGAKTATSLEEIATSMQKVAATSHTVGVSMEQVSSIIATVSSVTRESAESIGTSYKTIFARIGDLKLGKVDEDGVGLGQVSSQLDAIGVKILDESGNLREMGDIITDLGTKWQTMNEAQKTAVAQVVAGKRQYTQLMALFENWDMYQQNMDIATNSEGALQTMADTYAESWEAASQRTKAALEGIYNSIFNDQALIKMANSTTKLLEGINDVVDGLGGLPGIVASVGTVFTTVFRNKITSSINTAITSLANWGNSFKGMGIGQGLASFFKGESSAMRDYQRMLNETSLKANQQGKDATNSRDKLSWEHTSRLIQAKQKLIAVNDTLSQQERILAGDLLSSAQSAIGDVEALTLEYEDQKKSVDNLIKSLTSLSAQQEAYEKKNPNKKSIGLEQAAQKMQQTIKSNWGTQYKEFEHNKQAIKNQNVSSIFNASWGGSTQLQNLFAQIPADTAPKLETLVTRFRELVQASQALGPVSDNITKLFNNLNKTEPATAVEKIKLEFAALRNVLQESGLQTAWLDNLEKELIEASGDSEKFKEKLATVKTQLEGMSSAAGTTVSAAFDILANRLGLSNQELIELMERAGFSADKIRELTGATNGASQSLDNFFAKITGAKSVGEVFSKIINGASAALSSFSSFSSALSNWDDSSFTSKVTSIGNSLTSIASMFASGNTLGGIMAVAGAGIGYVVGQQEREKKKLLEEQQKFNRESEDLSSRTQSEITENNKLMQSYLELANTYEQVGGSQDELKESAYALADAYELVGAKAKIAAGDFEGFNDLLEAARIEKIQKQKDNLASSMSKIQQSVDNGGTYYDIKSSNLRKTFDANLTGAVRPDAELEALLLEDLFIKNTSQWDMSKMSSKNWAKEVYGKLTTLLSSETYQAVLDASSMTVNEKIEEIVRNLTGNDSFVLEQGKEQDSFIKAFKKSDLKVQDVYDAFNSNIEASLSKIDDPVEIAMSDLAKEYQDIIDIDIAKDIISDKHGGIKWNELDFTAKKEAYLNYRDNVIPQIKEKQSEVYKAMQKMTEEQKDSPEYQALEQYSKYLNTILSDLDQITGSDGVIAKTFEQYLSDANAHDVALAWSENYDKHLKGKSTKNTSLYEFTGIRQSLFDDINSNRSLYTSLDSFGDTSYDSMTAEMQAEYNDAVSEIIAGMLANTDFGDYFDVDSLIQASVPQGHQDEVMETLSNYGITSVNQINSALLTVLTRGIDDTTTAAIEAILASGNQQTSTDEAIKNYETAKANQKLFKSDMDAADRESFLESFFKDSSEDDILKFLNSSFDEKEQAIANIVKEREQTMITELKKQYEADKAEYEKLQAVADAAMEELGLDEKSSKEILEELKGYTYDSETQTYKNAEGEVFSKRGQDQHQQLKQYEAYVAEAEAAGKTANLSFGEWQMAQMTIEDTLSAMEKLQNVQSKIGVDLSNLPKKGTDAWKRLREEILKTGKDLEQLTEGQQIDAISDAQIDNLDAQIAEKEKELANTESESTRAEIESAIAELRDQKDQVLVNTAEAYEALNAQTIASISSEWERASELAEKKQQIAQTLSSAVDSGIISNEEAVLVGYTAEQWAKYSIEVRAAIAAQKTLEGSGAVQEQLGKEKIAVDNAITYLETYETAIKNIFSDKDNPNSLSELLHKSLEAGTIDKNGLKAFEEAYKEVIATFGEDISSDELIEEMSIRLGIDKSDLETQIAQIAGAGKDAVNSIFATMSQELKEKAQEAVDAWLSAFDTIAEARKTLLEGGSLIDQLAGDPKKIQELFQNFDGTWEEFTKGIIEGTIKAEDLKTPEITESYLQDRYAAAGVATLTGSNEERRAAARKQLEAQNTTGEPVSEEAVTAKVAQDYETAIKGLVEQGLIKMSDDQIKADAAALAKGEHAMGDALLAAINEYLSQAQERINFSEQLRSEGQTREETAIAVQEAADTGNLVINANGAIQVDGETISSNTIGLTREDGKASSYEEYTKLQEAISKAQDAKYKGETWQSLDEADRSILADYGITGFNEVDNAAINCANALAACADAAYQLALKSAKENGYEYDSETGTYTKDGYEVTAKQDDTVKALEEARLYKENMMAAAQDVPYNTFELKTESQDLDTSEVDKYGDSLQKAALSADDLDDSLASNAEAADEVARVLLRAKRAVEEISESYDGWIKSAKDAARSQTETKKLAKEVKSTLNDLMDLQEDYFDLNDEKDLGFLTDPETIDMMKDVAEGVEGAEDKMISSLTRFKGEALGLSDEIIDAWTLMGQELNDLPAGTEIEIGSDARVSPEFHNALNTAIASLYNANGQLAMGVDEANSILQSMGDGAGFDVEAVEAQHMIPGEVYYTPITEMVPLGADGGSVPAIVGWEPVTSDDGEFNGVAYRVTNKKGSSGGRVSGGSSGGGGGGGSKPQKKEKKKHKRTKDHVERYHENNEALKRISEELDKIDKLKGRAFGKNYVNYLNDETEALKDQKNAYQALKEEAEGYIQEDRDGLVNLGATFDAEGNINNYEKLVENIVKEYNRAVDTYNNSAQNDGDKENLEAAEEAFNDAMKLIEDYEEAMAQAAEAGIEMEDILNQISEIELEKITYELEVKLDLNERDIALLEYYQEKYENYLDKQDDIFNDFINKAAEYESNLGHLYNSYGQLIESYLGGDLLDAQYAEGLQDIQDQILDNLSELNSIQNELADTYANTLSMATEEIEKLTGALDDNNSTLQSYMDIVNLLSVNGPDYKTMDYFYTKMNDNNLRNINIQKKHYDALLKEEDIFEQKLAERGELTELEQKEYEALQEEIRSARDTLTSTTQEAMELVQAQYENTINGIADSLFNFSEIGAYSLEHLQDQYGYFQEQQERYVSTAKALTEVSKLNRDIEGQLAQSVSASSKEALKALQEKINKQAELNKMTEYDIEMNQLQYQLLLARIKLEEAENAKDVVRLTRDDNGNYAYQYTANQDKLDEAAQEYEDVLQQINDSTVQQTSEIEQKILNTMADYKEKLQEVALDYSLSEEERYARMQELSERFQETMYFLEDEYQTATSNLGENQAAMANHYGVSLESIMASTAGNVNSSIASMVGSMDEYVESVMSAFGADSDFNSAWATLQNNLQTIAQISGLTFGNMANDAEEMETEENRMIQQAEQLATTLTDTLKPINNLTTAWNNHYTALQNAITGYENLAIEIQDVLNTMSGFGNNTTNNSNNNPVPTAQVGGQHARGGLADYTGLAWLDGTKEDPELVLNPDDTHNMLKIVDSVRQLDPESIAMLMDSYKTNFASMYASLNSANISSIFQAQQSSDVLEQYVTITAEFPNASDRNEIKEVFDGLINRAAQFASRKK